MNRSAPWGAAVVGVGALLLILVRVLQGAWTMPLVVGIGVLGSLGTLLLWWQWDRRIFAHCTGHVRARGGWDVVVGGYVLELGAINPGRRPGRGEVVLAAGGEGLLLVDPRRREFTEVLRLSWPEVVDVAPGSGDFLGQVQPAIVVSTITGRLVLVVRTDERRGILSVGSAETEAVIEEIRHLRRTARFE
ncbi:hypothetical protein [Propionicimonas sp.]|uniref:hypothetical protein n=1 Tax=Propionicimonas sp. TaxID=1955623 RepID=UPI0039E5778C